MIKDNLTLRKISELTDTSINTVSRALNQKDGVSEETSERILRIALEQNYRIMAIGVHSEVSISRKILN